jgi:hypothetical protein
MGEEKGCIVVDFLKVYGDTLGPLDIPMRDAQAFALEAKLKALPAEDRVAHKAVVTAAVSELAPGERADVSWITTEAVDRQKDVLVARGMDESHFALNPLVTLNHNYWLPPVGRSLWRKRTQDGPTPGVKAKTLYPPRPANWPADQEWAPDSAFALVQAGLMNGKSVGYLAVKSHAPTAEEIKRRPELAQVRRVVDEWVLLEYCCCWLPVNPEAVTEVVAKAVAPGFAKAVAPGFAKAIGLPAPAPGRREPTPAELRSALHTALAAVDLAAVAAKAVQDGLATWRGRV